MATTDEILGVNRLPNETTKKLMAKKLETDTGAVTLMSEICLKVNNAKDKSKKLRVLRENDSQALRQILKGAFDPKIKWSLPLEGGPILTHQMTHQLAQNILFFYKKQELCLDLLKVVIQLSLKIKEKQCSYNY